jgi:hypothetical protein
VCSSLVLNLRAPTPEASRGAGFSNERSPLVCPQSWDIECDGGVGRGQRRGAGLHVVDRRLGRVRRGLNRQAGSDSRFMFDQLEQF